MNTRLEIIKSFIDLPPENDFQRGYFCALMDEAVDDMEDACSKVVVDALELFKCNYVMYENWSRRRKLAARHSAWHS